MLFEKLSEKYPDNKFLSLLAIKKIRQVIALLFWIVFILVIIFVFIKPSSNENVPKEEIKQEEKISLYDKYREILISKNYDYKYDINKMGIKTIYNGNMNGNVETGYIERVEGISKYYYDETGFYNVVNEEKVLIEKDELFDTYLSIDYLLSIMDEYTEEEDTISFQKEGIYGKMYLVDNTLNVEINENENIYLLEYYNFDK